MRREYWLSTLGSSAYMDANRGPQPLLYGIPSCAIASLVVLSFFVLLVGGYDLLTDGSMIS